METDYAKEERRARLEKKIWMITGIVLAVLFVFFAPMPMEKAKDGGSRQYCALTYTVVVWNRVTPLGGTRDGEEVYHKTSVYWFPKDQDLDSLWQKECEKVKDMTPYITVH